MSIELLDLSSTGIEFHSLGAATANGLSPHVFSLAFGVASRCEEDDLNSMRLRLSFQTFYSWMVFIEFGPRSLGRIVARHSREPTVGPQKQQLRL